MIETAVGSVGPVANIAAALTETAARLPYALAVACPAGRDSAGRASYTHWTFRQLDRESDLLARGLAAVGIGRGVRTVLMVKPGLEFFALTFALFKAGAVPVLVDPGMGVRNLGRCLAQARPTAFVGIPAAQLARRTLGWARATIKTSVTVRQVNPSGRVACPPKRRSSLSLALVREVGASERSGMSLVSPLSADEIAAILFTSGSTGPPKGVVYSHGIFSAQVAILRDLYDIRAGEIDLCTFPLFALFAPALGMSSVVPEMDATRPAQVDPRNIFDAIESFGVTNMFGSPALLRRVGEYGAERGLTLPSLRRVISAGAPVSAGVLKTFATMLSQGVQIFTPYGATESLPVATIGSDEILRETCHATDRGAGVCVGRPVRGMSVAIIPVHDLPIPAWSDTLPVPDGQVGEIAVRGPVVTRSYFDRPDATRLAKIPVEHGDDTVWHRMGDLGYRDEQGRIWFCGRKAHRVVSPTEVLDTIPCEAVFNTHPEVRRTALIGVGPVGVSRPVLCVEPKRWPLRKRDRLRIESDLAAIGARHEHTGSVQTFLFRKSFPVDIRHNAKIFREKLAVWAARRV